VITKFQVGNVVTSLTRYRGKTGEIVKIINHEGLGTLYYVSFERSPPYPFTAQALKIHKPELSVTNCSHPRLMPGLDTDYCPDCKQSIHWRP
jgi:hypothetical protein